MFRITDYKDTGTFIMGGTDEIQVRGGEMERRSGYRCREGRVIFRCSCPCRRPSQIAKPQAPCASCPLASPPPLTPHSGAS